MRARGTPRSSAMGGGVGPDSGTTSLRKFPAGNTDAVGGRICEEVMRLGERNSVSDSTIVPSFHKSNLRGISAIFKVISKN